VRISPSTRSRGAIRRSASVFVYPEVDDEIEIEIKDDDLRIDVFRAFRQGRAARQQDLVGGPHHAPADRNRGNRASRSAARERTRQPRWKMLKARLYERAVREREAKKAEVDKQKTDIAWGNQIRSYVFQPYTMVERPFGPS